jgi:hypothetical protein
LGRIGSENVNAAQAKQEAHLMSDWTARYVADIGYTFGYYSELNPLRAKLAFGATTFPVLKALQIA